MRPISRTMTIRRNKKVRQGAREMKLARTKTEATMMTLLARVTVEQKEAVRPRA
jgi:hypothetical protein